MIIKGRAEQLNFTQSGDKPVRYVTTFVVVHPDGQGRTLVELTDTEPSINFSQEDVVVRGDADEGGVLIASVVRIPGLGNLKLPRKRPWLDEPGSTLFVLVLGLLFAVPLIIVFADSDPPPEPGSCWGTGERSAAGVVKVSDFSITGKPEDHVAKLNELADEVHLKLSERRMQGFNIPKGYASGYSSEFQLQNGRLSWTSKKSGPTSIDLSLVAEEVRVASDGLKTRIELKCVGAPCAGPSNEPHPLACITVFGQEEFDLIGTLIRSKSTQPAKQ